MYDHADVVAETIGADGTPFRVILVPDCDTESPREWSNAGVMYVVDQPRHIVPQEGDVPGLDAAIIDHDFRVVARWLRVFHDATVVLPLYSAYGRDFNVAAGEATDAPTVGNYVGVTFDTPRTRREVMGPDAGTDVTGAALAADVAVYGQWAESETYGLIVQTAELDEDGDVVEWVDSDDDGVPLFGLIGREWAEESAHEALDNVVADHDDAVAEGREEDAELRAAELNGCAV